MNKIDVLKMIDAEVDKVVKIQGTPYDRKRKVSPETLVRMQKMDRKGKSISEIAKSLGLSYFTVKYNVDSVWREMYNKTRNGAHTGKDHISKTDRVAYKRQLVAEGKVTV